jgi:hypothetical protein
MNMARVWIKGAENVCHMLLAINEPYLTGISWTLQDTVGIGITACAIKTETWRVVAAH